MLANKAFEHQADQQYFEMLALLAQAKKCLGSGLDSDLVAIYREMETKAEQLSHFDDY